MRIRFACALALCLLAAHAAAAQAPSEELSFKLVMHEGGTPAYFDVGEKGFSIGGVSANGLRRLDAAPPPQVGERLRGFNLTVLRRGDRVVANLRLTREIDETLEMLELGKYEVGVGEERRVEALGRYGFEPPRLGLVRRAPIKLSPPPVVNLTRSIEVLGVEASDDKPELEVTLRNASGRNLMAVELRLLQGGVAKVDWTDRRVDGKPWALPEGVWKSKLKINGTADGTSAEGHHFEQPDRIVVASALFSDGGYEGDVESVAASAAAKLGQKIQARRALAVLRDWKEQEGAGLVDFAKELQRKARALPRAADDASVDELMKRFPELPAAGRVRMKGLVESGLKAVRTELLSGLKSFIEGGDAQYGPRQFEGWLTRLRAAYERILAVN